MASANQTINPQKPALLQKHADLERAIREETLRPNPDSLQVSEMKREKLRIKEVLDDT